MRRYKYLGQVIRFDLKNYSNYYVECMFRYNKQNQSYSVQYRIGNYESNNGDVQELFIDENIIAEDSEIKGKIAERIENMDNNHDFDSYVKEYEYIQDCITIGADSEVDY